MTTLSGNNRGGDRVTVEVAGPRTIVRTITLATGELVERRMFHLTRKGAAARIARLIFAHAVAAYA